MSGREWEPGDVIVGRVTPGRDDEVFYVVEVTANSRAAWGEGLHAINADGNGYRVDSIAFPRRLTMIDSTDHEQVRRLRDLHEKECVAYGDSRPTRDLDPLIDALREFADPTPPPEHYLRIGVWYISETGDQMAWVERVLEDATDDHSEVFDRRTTEPISFAEAVAMGEVLSQRWTP